MTNEEKDIDKLRHVEVDVYDVLLTRIHKAMKDWGFSFTEALNLFLDWGSIHAVRYMERKREERKLIEEKKKKENVYVN